MSPKLSPNTQAILLLTGPLINGRGSSNPDLLSPGEYRRLARHLRDLGREPADFVGPGASALIEACKAVIEKPRLQRLLQRGFQLSQVVERWQSRAIWVVSRADSQYPRRLKLRLREEAPAVLYGCGDQGILENGGLAVVGSRDIGESLLDYTAEIGRLTARAGRTLVSGGARGVDQAAMRGALEAGGRAVGVMADSLERTTMNREHRDLLLGGQLVLVSPYDPNAGFQVGHAMQRNKAIYALADAAVVVSSDFKKGGTWAGAAEQLEKLHIVPVYVRSTGPSSPGLNALRVMGAMPWPEPQNNKAFGDVFVATTAEEKSARQPALELFSATSSDRGSGAADDTPRQTPSAVKEASAAFAASNSASAEPFEPADIVFASVRGVLQRLLVQPMKDADIATALEVSTAQAKSWLQRLVDADVLEKLSKPVRYVLRSQPSLLDNNEISGQSKRTTKRRP